MTHFCGFPFQSNEISLNVLTVCTYFTIVSTLDQQTRKTDLLIPSGPFLIIVFGFVIRNNVSTSDPFAQYLVPMLDSSKSLIEYIRQVSLAAFPSLVYSNNGIKAAQTGGGLSVLQMISLTIVYKTIFLSGDARR